MKDLVQRLVDALDSVVAAHYAPNWKDSPTVQGHRALIAEARAAIAAQVGREEWLKEAERMLQTYSHRLCVAARQDSDAKLDQCLAAKDNLLTHLRSHPAFVAPVGQDDALKALRGASVIMSNLPALPGFNGSVLNIDDTEAARIVKEIDAGIALIEWLRSYPAFVPEVSRADIETLWRAHAPCNITDYGIKPLGGVHTWLIEMSKAMSVRPFVPEGFALVPIEPTDKAVIAGMNSAQLWYGRAVKQSSIGTIYKAMIAASGEGK